MVEVYLIYILSLIDIQGSRNKQNLLYHYTRNWI